MKTRLFALALAAIISCNTALFARDSFFNFGIQGGVNAASFNNVKTGGIDGFHAGVTGLIKLPLYISIQPSILYDQSKTNIEAVDASKILSQNLTIPVSVQWGPDLGLIRLFAQVVPYASLNLGLKGYDANNNKVDNATVQALKDEVKKCQFGVGLGGGVCVWNLQLGLRYNWGLGDWANVKSSGINAMKGQKYNSFTASLAFFF